MKLTLNGLNKNKDGGGGVSIITLPPDVDTEKQVQNNQCDVTTTRGQGVKSRRVWTVVLAIWTVVTIVVVSTAAWQISQQYRADTFHEEEEQVSLNIIPTFNYNPNPYIISDHYTRADTLHEHCRFFLKDRIWLSRSNPGFDLSKWNEFLRVFLSRSG